MEICIATNSSPPLPIGKSRNEKHDQFVKRRLASRQPNKVLNKRDQREKHEKREANSKQAAEWRKEKIVKSSEFDATTKKRAKYEFNASSKISKKASSSAAPAPNKLMVMEKVTSTAPTEAAQVVAPAHVEAVKVEIPEVLHTTKLPETQNTAASDAVGRVEGSKDETKYSRKNPGRIEDEAYSTYHMTAQELSANALRNPVASTSSSHIFATAESFSEFDLHPRLVSLLQAPRESGGFALERPTRVQSGALESLLGGRSAFLKAQTGSGKTLAFLLPLVQKLQALPVRSKREDGTLALILAPTRELCTQIYDVLVRLIQPFIWLVPGAITGGERRKSEKQRLRKGVTILVATPGRLIDHLHSTESFRHDRLSTLVLDEADRLMDSGFATQIQDILRLLRARDKLQTILASATATEAVKALLLEHMGPHDVVDANPPEGERPAEGPAGARGGDAALAVPPSSKNFFDTPKQLTQHSINVTYKLRLPALCALLRQCWRDRQKVILFVSTTAAVDYLASLFANCSWPHDDVASHPVDTAALFHGWPLFRLHGNIPQLERQAAKKAFHSTKCGLLVTTDVAARGLDLPNVDWVIQLDAPTAIEDYVHRIGRTARRGRPGSSILFLSPNESSCLDCLARRGLVLSPLSLEATFERGFSKVKGVPKTSALTLHEALENKVASSSSLQELALAAFQAFLRAYAIHAGELKAVFAVRSLHLGHVARSFALQEAPKTVRQVAPAKKAAALAKSTKRSHADANSEKHNSTEDGAKSKKAAKNNTRTMGYEISSSASGI